ncbi:hypothetical protein D3C75_1098440 [compost metagenome]
MGFANVIEQRRLHLLSGGRFTLERRALFVDLHDLCAVEVGGHQRIRLTQRVGHQCAIDAPVPIFLPGQRLERVGWWLAGAGGGLCRIDLGLLIGVEHFHQQAALWALGCQFTQ